MIERILLLNGPDDRAHAVMIRSGDRWPHRLPRKLSKQVPHAYPFWFAQCGALLKRRGYRVHYTDSIAEGLGIDGTVERFRDLRPDMVVIATSTPTIHTDLLMARLAREKAGAFTVLVDTHATVFHRELVGEAFVDAAVRGEFEVAVADLADAKQIPDERFDAIILTQTLQLIFDPPAALRTLHRILKPGGRAAVVLPEVFLKY